MSTRNNPRIFTWYVAIAAIIIIISFLANKDEKPTYTPKIKSRYTPEPKEQKPTITEYTKKYAGEYEIFVDDYYDPGIHEKLILDQHGYCTWQWIQDGYVRSTKRGTWTADKGYIYTVVRGNTEDIPEEYRYKNGAFRNGHRYLKRIKKL